MNNTVTADNATLFRQASMTAEEYLRKAKESIDAEFGEGHAKSHPELVAGFMQCAAADFHASVQARTLDEKLGGIGYALDSIASALRDRG